MMPRLTLARNSGGCASLHNPPQKYTSEARGPVRAYDLVEATEVLKCHQAMLEGKRGAIRSLAQTPCSTQQCRNTMSTMSCFSIELWKVGRIRGACLKEGPNLETRRALRRRNLQFFICFTQRYKYHANSRVYVTSQSDIVDKHPKSIAQEVLRHAQIHHVQNVQAHRGHS